LGSNDVGQLGLGVKDVDPHPATDAWVRELSDAIDLAVGARHVCAVTSKRRVQCWGANQNGQLGDGTRDDRFAPTWVVAPRSN
jgi:alpha-tubulin suppressor-like RCC1 family protein